MLKHLTTIVDRNGIFKLWQQWSGMYTASTAISSGLIFCFLFWWHNICLYTSGQKCRVNWVVTKKLLTKGISKLYIIDVYDLVDMVLVCVVLSNNESTLLTLSYNTLCLCKLCICVEGPLNCESSIIDINNLALCGPLLHLSQWNILAEQVKSCRQQS